MKCSNPNCNRGIGLVAYRRGWFGKQRYCSRRCRDAFVADAPRSSQQERNATTYFEWLFLRTSESPQQRPSPGRARLRTRSANQTFEDGNEFQFRKNGGSRRAA